MFLMTNRTKRLTRCFQIMLPVLFIGNLPVCGIADDALSLLISDWESREARFETGHIEFQSTEIYPPKTTLGRNERTNQQTVERIQEHKIIFDGRRGRFTRSGPTLDFNTNSVVFQSYTSTFDGQNSYQLHEGSHFDGHPSGKVYTSRGSILGRGWDYHSAPIFMSFRPLTETLQGVNPRGWKPATNVSVNGINASVYSAGVFDYVVDPSREHVVIRIDYYRPRGEQSRDLYIRLDIQYGFLEQFGHVPESWTLTKIYPPSGQPQMMIDGRTITCDFNQPVSDEDFIINFPPGSVVHDNRQQVKAVVEADGSYNVLHRSAKSDGLSAYLHWIFASAGVLIVIFMLWFRRRQNV